MNSLQQKILDDVYESFAEELGTASDAEVVSIVTWMMYAPSIPQRYLAKALEHSGARVTSHAFVRLLRGTDPVERRVFDLALNAFVIEREDDVHMILMAAAQTSKYYEVEAIARMYIQTHGMMCPLTLYIYVGLKNGRADPKKHLQPMIDAGVDFSKVPSVLPGAMRVPGMARELVKLGIPKSAAYDVSLRYMNQPWYRDALTREL